MHSGVSESGEESLDLAGSKVYALTAIVCLELNAMGHSSAKPASS